MTGSGYITIIPNEKGIKVTIFNITSLTSGSLGKEAFDVSKWTKSYVRDPFSKTLFGNISQTFHLFIPHEEILKIYHSLYYDQDYLDKFKNREEKNK